jgi:hypothetical protein
VKPEPGSWQADLAELVETLRRHRVPFVIAGGFAVAHAGYLRGTKDVDLFVPRLPGIDERLAAALTAFLGAEVSVDEAKQPFLRFFRDRPGAFDIIRKLPGVTWATAWRDRSTGTLFGVRVPFLGIDALIRNKRAVARHVDLADVEALLKIRRGDR